MGRVYFINRMGIEYVVSDFHNIDRKFYFNEASSKLMKLLFFLLNLEWFFMEVKAMRSN